MLHGKFVYAVVFRGAGFASDAVGIALETGGYRAAAAHELAVKLSAKPRMVRKLVASSVLFGRVVAHLHRGLSPERIAFTRNRIDQPVRISHETIYTALYAIHPTDEDLSAGTPATPPHGRRPVRGDPGHWQGGQIKGKRNQFQVGTLVERTTLYVTLVKLENGRAETAAESFAEILNRFDAALHDV